MSNQIKNYFILTEVEENYKNNIFLAENTEREKFIIKASKSIYEKKTSSLLRELHNFEKIGKTPYSYNIREYFSTSDREYLVFDFIEGTTLDKIVEQDEKLTKDISIFYIQQILDFFIILYSKGFLYRDLKPQNIIVSQNNNLKLIDFELIEKVGFSSELSFEDRIEGSLLFNCSPSRLNGKKEGVTTELYSIGMLFYYLIKKETLLIEDDFESIIALLQNIDHLQEFIKEKINKLDKKSEEFLSYSLLNFEEKYFSSYENAKLILDTL